MWLLACVRECCRYIGAAKLATVFSSKTETGPIHGQDGEKLFLLPHLNLYAVWDSFLSMPQSWRHCYRVLTAYLFSKSDPWPPHGGRRESPSSPCHACHASHYRGQCDIWCDVWELTRDCWRSVHSETSCPEPEPIFIQRVTSRDFSSVEAPLHGVMSSESVNCHELIRS